MSNRGEERRIEVSNSRAMGVIVLIALLFVFQVVTFIVQKIRKGTSVQQTQRLYQSDAPVPFGFNPNTVTSDSLQMLGFSGRQAQTILKYREKGGKFRVRKDFAKMYVVDSARYAALEPYILLPDSLPAQKVQKMAESRTKSSAKRKKVQKTAESYTKFPAEGKKVQKLRKFDAKPGTSPGASPGTSHGISTDTLDSRKDAAGAVYGSRVEANRYVCNLNTADSAALVRLYGIGGYYAGKILQYRERLGGSFVHKRQLLEIEGFSQERFSRIEDNVVVEGIKGFSLLGADRKALERHPYIGPYAARGIITYIRIMGKEAFADELQLLEGLVKEHIITENNAERLREYLLHL